MKIILIGSMGSGKTFIGSLLSSLIKYKHYDLDNIIEKLYNMSIMLIYYLFGEKNFRLIEKKILNIFLKYNNNNFILSVGGGTPCFYNNIKIMNYKGITFYLKTNYKILYKRLYKDKNRPLLKNYKKKKLYNLIKKKIKKRNKYYKKAKYIINTNKLNYIEIIEYIKNIILKNKYDKKI
ncbi:MAG: shikimate kinase [Candidatus Shikimatogenerans sp. JK-2022]|nr:shikimate kinase [Candidatus Shikimatogenerans bostrichidophilus]